MGSGRYHSNAARTASILITLFGAVTNTVLTIQVLAAWRSLKWETETEWESSGDNWQLGGIKVVWALLFVYFSSAASVCAVGLVGVLKNKPNHVRFYRDYSIADFSFCAILTALATYGAFLGPARAGVCEAFSHHPELMRDMLEMGLNLENCERWLERAVFAFLAVMFVIMIVRLHFLLAVSTYYSHLVLVHHRCSSPLSSSSTVIQSHTMHRIFLLPAHPNTDTNTPTDLEHGDAIDMVYAPVARHTLPKDIQTQLTEAWISHPTSGSSTSSSSAEHRHHHHQRHHHHHSHGQNHRRRHSGSSDPGSQTGRIRLEIKPDEGLLPFYTSAVEGMKE